MDRILRCVAACVALLAAAALACSGAEGVASTQLKYNKSWVGIRYDTLTKPIFEGDKLEVVVEYYLDPSEDVAPTALMLEWLGPKGPLKPGERPSYHTYYGNKRVTAQPGRHTEVFTITVPPANPQNYLLFLARFDNWPWHVRAWAWYCRKGGFFELVTDKPGNLFTYDEPVKVALRLKNVKGPAQQKRLDYKVYDTTGAQAASGTLDFTAQRDGQEVAIDLDLKRRGTFLIEVDVPGWEKLHTTFARIPDLMAITKGERTQFGMTASDGAWLAKRTEEVFQIARRLGLTACRAFTDWDQIEPGPGVYQLENWDHFMEMAQKHGVDMIILPWDPPAWVLPEGKEYSYNAFECNLDGWQDMVKTVTTRWKGKFYGWEWLNELTPGGSPNYADDYLKMCRIGTTTAKSIYPEVKTMLAGGLYPRSFRLQMLKAGVGQYIDILPVHYQNGDGVLEARQDLDSAGCRNVAVWEDESGKEGRAKGHIWTEPLEDLKDTGQADWVLMQWTDELAAGCERIIYFGGDGTAEGGADYILADGSPRPVAATLAVFASKLFKAKPVGVFLLGKGGLFHLFDQSGKAVVVASTYEASGEKVSLAVGTDKVRITDYQGNETVLSATAGKAELDLSRLRCFIEDADLDVLKAYVMPSIETARVGAGTSANVAEARKVTPRVTMLRGREGSLNVRIRNLYGRRLEGSFKLELPQDWPQKAPTPFALEPGADALVPVGLAIPDSAEPRDYSVNVTFTFAWAKLPPVVKPVVLSVISSEMAGNLVKNGGFEIPVADGKAPSDWGVGGTEDCLVSSEGLGDGLGRYVVRFSNSQAYQSLAQSVPVRGGQTYLYTAWVWNQNMSAGSNMTATLEDGREIRYYDVQVFTCGTDSPYWQMYVCRRELPPATKSLALSPLASGPGRALFDNLRLTVYGGTDYAAECYRAKSPVKIDGKLDDWVTACPIPLIGKNQLTVVDPSYKWTPQNLNGVAYLMWDDTNLYVAAQVRDDVHHTVGTGDDAIKGDSLILAFDPTNRSPEAAQKAFAYYVSAAAPGGGSGAHTIYRPEALSGGLRSGQLFRDSSIYEIVVSKGEGTCVYEMRIPISELGGIQPGFGAKFGFSIQLNDSDGKGLEAHMNWGDGISPSWAPGRFGLVTLVE